MYKYLIPLCVIFILSSCFKLNKPFSDESNIKIIKEDIFISEIIGLKKKEVSKLKNIIYNKLTEKNILSSYKFSNTRSNILSASIVKYSNNYNIIWKLYNPNKDQILKYVFNIDKKINNSFDLFKIANDIVNTIEIEANKNKNYIFIKIIDIYNLNNIRKKIFIENLIESSKNYKIKYLFNSNNHESHFNINIQFNFIEINEYETKLAINWILLNANNNIIGNIEQEKIITNNLIKSLWPQLSKKIIEMALNDIVYLINLEK